MKKFEKGNRVVVNNKVVATYQKCFLEPIVGEHGVILRYRSSLYEVQLDCRIRHIYLFGGEMDKEKDNLGE